MAHVEDESQVSLLGPPKRKPRQSRTSIFDLLQSAKNRLAGSELAEASEDSSKSSEEGDASPQKQRHPSVYALLRQATKRVGPDPDPPSRTSGPASQTQSGNAEADPPAPSPPPRVSARNPVLQLLGRVSGRASAGEPSQGGEPGDAEASAPGRGERTSLLQQASACLSLRGGPGVIEADAEASADASVDSSRAPPRTGCMVCTAILGILAGAIGSLMCVTLFAYQGRGPATPCAGRFPFVEYVRRGNLVRGQENTFDAVVAGAAAEGQNPQVDVRALADGTAVLFHDETLQRLTGADGNIADASTPLPPILQDIDGYAYDAPNNITKLAPVVRAICRLKESVGINLDVKVEAAVEAAVAALKVPNCSATRLRTIFSTHHHGVAKKLSDELKTAGLDNRVALRLPTGAYAPLGLKFFLKTRLLHALAPGASVVQVHKTVLAAEPDLLRSWRDDGWCIGVWGLSAADVPDYEADVYVVDEAPAFPDLAGGLGADGGAEATAYDDDSLAWYYALIAVAVVCLLTSLLLLVATCGMATRKNKAGDKNLTLDDAESMGELSNDLVDEDGGKASVDKGVEKASIDEDGGTAPVSSLAK